MSETRQIDFLKTFFLHYFLLALLSLSFRAFFAFHFGWWNTDVLTIALPQGFTFDLAVAGILSFLFTLLVFISSKPQVASLAYLILMTCLFSDLLYFQESSRHLSYEIWDLLNASNELLTYLVRYSPYFLACALVALALWFLSGRICFWATQTSVKRMIISIVICLIVTLISVRGGVTGIPQNPAFAFRVSDHKLAQMTLNGAYAMFYSLFTGRRIQMETLQIPEGLDIESNVRKLFAKGDSVAKPAPQKYNIVFFFLEGWPAEYSKSYGYSEDVTPNFDAYRKHSLTTAVTIAGGKRTTEGMFATLCSYPNPLGKTIMFSHLENQRYNCLPEILRAQGWHTAYMQGTNNMTSGVGAFANKAGFTMSVGKMEYPHYNSVEKNSWGLYDTDLYNWAFDEMSKVQEPFFLSLGTNTTHDLSLPKGVPWTFGKETIQQKNRSVLNRADVELKAFIDKMEFHNWKYPVLYVLVSDHTSHVTSSDFNSYRIPFAIYSKNLKPQYFDFPISQRDIAPTVLDLLGLPKPDMTGLSLFEKAPYRMGEYYNAQRLGYVINESYIELSTRDSSLHKCYNWRTDFKMEHPRACSPQELEEGLLGLSFTKLSQELLFKNEAREFQQKLAP